MQVIMRKITRYDKRFFARGTVYEVSETTGKRWIRKGIAYKMQQDPEETVEPEVVAKKNVTVLEDEEDFVEMSEDLEVDETENNAEPSLRELKIIAKSEGIKGYSKMGKPELLEILKNGNNNKS